MIEIEPELLRWTLADGCYVLGAGKIEDAIDAYQKSLSLSNNQIALGSLGALYAETGKPDKARAILNQLFEMKERRNVNSLNIARVYCALNEDDKTVEWLEKSIEERNGELIFLELETKVFTARSSMVVRSFKDPRISELLTRAGLMS